MTFENSSNIDARDGIFQAMGRVTINYSAKIINISDGRTDVPARRPPMALKASVNPLSRSALSRPFSALTKLLPTPPEIKTISTESDGGNFVASSPASIQTERSSSTGNPPSPSVSMLSNSPQSAAPNETRVSQFEAEDGSIAAVTLEGLIEQLITDISCG